MGLGHDISTGLRTLDVRITQDISFDTMLLSKATHIGLKKAGFLRPSPVQLRGIPLGKCGFDLLLEAKSGTGKTAVFTVISLEKLDLNKGLQTIILAPTREIASQISDVITEIGSQHKGLNVVVVMGGLPVHEDIAKFKQNVHIVVGSPGRLRHLIQDKHIDTSSVRLFVLDEADKLMESSFLPDINYIFSLLPKQKQVIMSSATYSEETKTFVTKYVQKAHLVCPDSNSILLGIAQKVVTVPYNSNILKQTKNRYEELKKIMNKKQFKQCLIFCNYQVRVGEVHRMLSKDKWPVEQLYGKQDQTDRLDALKTLQEYKCRVLVSTDLAARGIDAANVDLVINFEPPYEWETYLHRIGRAGRYGSYGTAITILSEGKEKAKFRETLALTNIPFELNNLWDDEPFPLSLNPTEDATEKNGEPITVPSHNVPFKNSEMSEDMLWKALTTRSLDQDDTKPSSFEELCNEFNISNGPNIESFADLMHSFTKDQNNMSKNTDSVEFKHVKVAKLPVDSAIYWDNLQTGSTNQVISLPSCMPMKTYVTIKNDYNNEDLVHEKESKDYERYLTESMEKDTPKNQTPECTKSKIDTDIRVSIQMNKEQNFGNKPYENKIDSMEQCLNAGLPTALEKANSSKSHATIHYYNISDEKKTSKLESYNINQNANLTHTLENQEPDYCESDGVEADPIKQSMLNAGLPTAFGKKKQNKKRNQIHRYSTCNGNKERKNVEKSKVKQVQSKSIKIQESNTQVAEKANSSKTFTKNDHLSINVDGNDQSESSCETSCHKEENMHKLVNDYPTYASTFDNSFSHQKYKTKKPSNIREPNRSKQFDMWYSQLKRQTQYIQSVLYIEELRKL